MISELEYAEKMYRLGGYTLFLCSGGKVYFSEERGIKPLLELVGTDEWRGAYAADKIVGKAAAMLYLLLGIKAVYAEVIGKSAKELFDKNDVEYKYGTLADVIINRRGDGMCPMEEAVKDIENPADAPDAIKAKLAQLKK